MEYILYIQENIWRPKFIIYLVSSPNQILIFPLAWHMMTQIHRQQIWHNLKMRGSAATLVRKTFLRHIDPNRYWSFLSILLITWPTNCIANSLFRESWRIPNLVTYIESNINNNKQQQKSTWSPIKRAVSASNIVGFYNFVFLAFVFTWRTPLKQSITIWIIRNDTRPVQFSIRFLCCFVISFCCCLLVISIKPHFGRYFISRWESYNVAHMYMVLNGIIQLICRIILVGGYCWCCIRSQPKFNWAEQWKLCF